MPVRALSSTDREESFSSSSPHAVPLSPSRLQSIDRHDDRRQSDYGNAHYDLTAPPHIMRFQHSPFSLVDHIYPRPVIPAPLPTSHVAIPPLTVRPVLAHMHPHSQPVSLPSSWHQYHQSIYRSSSQQLPPPPPIPHKVWILDCKSCGMFLTNRGMKAVLLLRPNVPLYSTDALPINCSAYSSQESSSTRGGNERPPPPASPPRTSGSIDSERARGVSRTCECLTQTLCCHGCGSGVGYMIVIPCQRCTSSITATNRTTNGHRFVFYSSEIAAEERHYILGECGVHPYHPIPPPALYNVSAHPASITLPSSHPPGLPMLQSPIGWSSNHPPQSPTDQGSSLFSSDSSRHSSRHSTADSMPSLRTITTSSSGTSADAHPNDLSVLTASRRGSLGGPVPPPPPPSHSTSPHNPEISRFPPSGPDGLSNSADVGGVSGPREGERIPEPLKAGEVLYWHHLVRTGEIPAVVEDPRARRSSNAPTATAKGASAQVQKAVGPVAPAKMRFAGR